LRLSCGAHFIWAGTGFAQSCFDPVKLLYLGERPLRVLAFLFGLKKLAPRVRQAAGKFDALCS
jgi:hypothetical protein